MNQNKQSEDVTDRWQCANCGESGSDGVPCCPECGSLELGSPEKITNLPPCWKESNHAAAVGVNRLFVHLDGPGFIGVENETAKLVTADLAEGENPDPKTRPATVENIHELAECYNDEFYGEDNRSLQPDAGRSKQISR